jgi:predicted metal-binding membrane protein
MNPVIEEVARRGRVIVGIALGALVLLACLYTIRVATDMRYMGGASRAAQWFSHFLLTPFVSRVNRRRPMDG